MGRLVAGILILTLGTPAFAWDREGFKRDVAWLTATGAADVLSTRYALEHCSACYEANPLHRGPMVLSRVLFTGVTLWGLRELRKRGRDDLATWMRWAIVAFWSAVASWNLTRSHSSP